VENELILGDNLEIMRQLPSESIDLIYLDPPFFSNRNYEVIWGDEGEIRSFQDRWSGGIDHYIGWLKERVQEMYRLLKPTGSIFLHCDWHADAYIRVHILDKIFGAENFRNEIAWHYSGWNKQLSKHIERRHDSIFFYSKSENSYFEYPARKWDSKEEYIQKRKQKVQVDENNREYVLSDAGGGQRVRRYLDEAMEYGVPLDDVWDIDKINNSDKGERIGYPTQKPEKLLERIIKIGSKEGDIVLDPFVGGGTTIVVADILNRHWIGIDQSVQAVKVSELRIYNKRTLFSAPFSVKLHKYDYDTLRYKDAFAFEAWIVEQYGGTSNTKQRGDFGIDGRTREGLPIQVKRSDNIGRNVIDNFRSACERFDQNLFERNKKAGQPIGVLIAFTFGKGAIEEVARLKIEQGIVIQLLQVEEIVPIAKKPKVSVTIRDLGVDEKGNREIEFTAIGESDSGIEMYSWDWDYNQVNGFKPEILLDKEGVQVRKLKPDAYTIAVRVFDNQGLESTEVIRLKVNGKIKRL
jgi:DNA modification methylase